MGKVDRTDIQSYLPVKPVILHILLALHGTESHGYAVIQTVRAQAGQGIQLSSGSFYRHFAWLIKRGLVAETSTRPRDADPRRGTYYRLTELGCEVLSAEGGRLQEVLEVIESKGILPDQQIA